MSQVYCEWCESPLELGPSDNGLCGACVDEALLALDADRVTTTVGTFGKLAAVAAVRKAERKRRRRYSRRAYDDHGQLIP